jgi:hypothetical protein
LEFNGRLEVEGLNKGGFSESLSVSNTLDLNAFRVRSDSQLGVLPDSLLNDVCNVLKGWCQLFQLVIAEGNVVCDIALVSCHVHCVLEFLASLLILLFLEEKAALSDDHFRGVWWHLRNQGLCM